MKETVTIMIVLAIAILAMATTLIMTESDNSGDVMFPNVTGPSECIGRDNPEECNPNDPKKAVAWRPQYHGVLLFNENDYDLVYSIQCKMNELVLSNGEKVCIRLYSDEIFGGSKVHRSQIMLNKCKLVFVVLSENTHKDYYVVDLKDETVACTRFGDEANDERRYCVLPLHTQPKEKRSYKVPCGLRHAVGIEWYQPSEKMNQLRQLLENKKCVRRKTDSKVPRTWQREDAAYDTTAAVDTVKKHRLRSHKTSKMLKGYQYKYKLKSPITYNGVDRCYAFAHQSIYKAVGVAFGKKYIKEILVVECCHLDFLVDHTVLSVKDITAKENVISVSEVDYDDLIFRIVKEVKDGQWKVFRHNAFANDAFVKIIFSYKLFTHALKQALCNYSFIKQLNSSRILYCLALSTSCGTFCSNVIACLKPLKRHMIGIDLLRKIHEGACISLNLKTFSNKIKVKDTLDECFLKSSACPEDNSKIISFTDKNVRIILDYAYGCLKITKLCTFLIQKKGIDQTILDNLRYSKFDLKQKQKKKTLESLISFGLKCTGSKWLHVAAGNVNVAGIVEPIVQKSPVADQLNNKNKTSRIVLHHLNEGIAQKHEYDDVLIFAEEDSDLALSTQCEMNERVLSNGQKACVRLYTDEVFGGSKVNKPDIMSKKCNRLSFLLTENTHKDDYVVYLMEETVSDVHFSERNQTTTTDVELSYQYPINHKSNGHMQFLMA